MKTQFFTLSCFIALTSVLQVHAMKYDPSKLNGWELTSEEPNQEIPSGQIQPSQPPFDFEKDEKYTTLLSQAKQNGEEEKIKNLLNAIHRGCDSSVSSYIGAIKKTPLGILPLEIAIRDSHSTITQLLAAYADNTEIEKAFIIAAIHNQQDITTFLLKNYTFTLSDTDKHKIIADGCSNEGILKAISPERQSICIYGEHFFLYRDTTTAEECCHSIDTAPDAVKNNYRKESLLYTAVESDNTAAIKFFISHGAGLLGVRDLLVAAAKNLQTKKYLLDNIRSQEKIEEQENRERQIERQKNREAQENSLCSDGCLLQ